MVSLLDIAPLSTTVDVRGNAIPVYGVSALGVASLLRRFPQLQEVLSGKTISLTVDDLLQLVPEAIASIIAAGTGNPSLEHEQAAAGLTVQEQTELLRAIFELTFPRGLNPFLEGLAGLKAAAGLGDGSKGQPGN
jgi:hypothetical protein